MSGKKQKTELEQGDKVEDLNSLRAQIDSLDEKIQELLNARAQCAQKVAEVKKRDAGDGRTIYYRPEREAELLRKVMGRNNGPLSDEAIARLFREIMSESLALERVMQIGYLGPAGTFTQAAALKHFGHAVESVPFNTIDEVFRELAAGAIDYGVVPVENSTEGVVNHTLDSFIDSSAKICGEVELRIHQHFLISPDQKPENVKRIYTHQQSLAQCRKWLDNHWGEAEQIAVNSNAEAARLVKNEKDSAAIAGDMAAEQYQLRILTRNIEDNPKNTTRFLIIGDEDVPPSGKDKTSVVIATKNQPGALYKILAPFHDLGISLTRIETRPSKVGNWSYVFFIDFEGHVTDTKVQKLWQLLANEVTDIRPLGSYPEAVL